MPVGITNEKCTKMHGISERTVVASEVAALAHEVGDDAGEAAALVAEALLARAQSAEVLCLPSTHA